MRSILDQLDSDEAVLLLYMADELPASDRAEVERRLAKDGKLSDQLESLRSMQAQLNRSLEQLDAAQPAPGSLSSSQRAIVRAIRQKQAEQLQQAQRPVAPAA